MIFLAAPTFMLKCRAVLTFVPNRSAVAGRYPAPLHLQIYVFMYFWRLSGGVATAARAFANTFALFARIALVVHCAVL
jgi:hypothetical protein